MKYFGFLARFVVIPLAALTLLHFRDRQRGKRLPAALNAIPAEAALLGHVAVAVTYTTPWDNYLVATRVWWYDPKRVTGLVLGYVPIEEYTFFVLQTLLAGKWMLYLAKHLPMNNAPPAHPLRVRIATTALLAALWGASVYNLLRGPKSRTYLSLTLSWALIPIMFQAAFGGDILWQHRRLVALGIVPTTLYLGAADAIAIEGGNWTISPEKTVNVKLGGKLPLEEGLFFLITNVLVTFGMTLVLSPQSQQRVPAVLRRYFPSRIR